MRNTSPDSFTRPPILPGPCVGMMADTFSGDHDALRAVGAVPCRLVPLNRRADADAFLDALDGLFLGGAPDVEPGLAGVVLRAAEDDRWAGQRRLIRRAVARRVPILAVGGGMQALNVACGGTLYASLREERPQALPHQGTAGHAYSHAVLLEAGSRVATAYGSGEVRVASAHERAVRRPPQGLRATAWAPDGVIEAIEGTEPDWFGVGIQWALAGVPGQRLLTAFMEACRRSPRSMRAAA